MYISIVDYIFFPKRCLGLGLAKISFQSLFFHVVVSAFDQHSNTRPSNILLLPMTEWRDGTDAGKASLSDESRAAQACGSRA